MLGWKPWLTHAMVVICGCWIRTSKSRINTRYVKLNLFDDHETKKVKSDNLPTDILHATPIKNIKPGQTTH